MLGGGKPKLFCPGRWVGGADRKVKASSGNVSSSRIGEREGKPVGKLSRNCWKFGKLADS